MEFRYAPSCIFADKAWVQTFYGQFKNSLGNLSVYDLLTSHTTLLWFLHQIVLVKHVTSLLASPPPPRTFKVVQAALTNQE